MEYVVNMNLMYIFTGIGRKHYPNTIREEFYWNFIWNIGRLKAKALIRFPPPPQKKKGLIRTELPLLFDRKQIM
jgi:hypothetical protein